MGKIAVAIQATQCHNMLRKKIGRLKMIWIVLSIFELQVKHSKQISVSEGKNFIIGL